MYELPVTEVMEGVIFLPGKGFNSNIYLVGKDEIGIIDAGASPGYVSFIIDTILEFKLQRANVKKLILTHIHPDHTGGAPGVIKAFNPTIYMHKAAGGVLIQKFGDQMQLLEGGETLDIDWFSFEVIHTPGHSPGGMCLYDKEQKLLFSGDTVFSGGNIGRTDLHGGNSQLLIESIEKLHKLDVQFLCPGHMPCVTDANKHIERSLAFARMVF